MSNLIRIGFDDERARGTVSIDFMAAGYTDTLMGVWNPDEMRLILARARLMKEITRISGEMAAGNVTIHEAVEQAQEAAKRYGS